MNNDTNHVQFTRLNIKEAEWNGKAARLGFSLGRSCHAVTDEGGTAHYWCTMRRSSKIEEAVHLH